MHKKCVSAHFDIICHSSFLLLIVKFELKKNALFVKTAIYSTIFETKLIVHN